MSARIRLSNDPYITGLKRRWELAEEWFAGIARILQSDLEDLKNRIAAAPGSAFAMESLDLQVIGGAPAQAGGSAEKHPSELTLSTRFSKVKLVANDPPGWLSIEVTKRSPLFDGVLHRGAIEVTLVNHPAPHPEVHFIECDWLCPDGSLPKTVEEAADKFWDILFLPKIRHQLAAAQKGPGH